MFSCYRTLQLCMTAAALFAATADAQDQYPGQQIKIIVLFSAGGGTDITARLIGEQMRNNAVKVPNVLTVNTDVPAKNIQELIAYARANPGKLSYASSGIGNAQHLTGEMLNKMAGISVQHIPFKGASQQPADTVGKHLTYTFASIGASLLFIQSAKLRPIAVASLMRASVLPEVPAIAEYKPPATFELVNFFGMYAPAGTPDPIIRWLNAAIQQALKTPELTVKLRELGFEPAPTTPEQFRDFLRAESAKFAKIIVDANVKVDQ